MNKLKSKECYSFSDGERIMPVALPKEGLKQMQLLHAIFLLKSQAVKYKKLVWGKKNIKIIKVKVYEI